MDDDRKVTEIVERSKMIFLKEIIDEFKKKQQQYDPAVEFAKTRKNRSVFVPMTVVVLLVVFAAVVVGVTAYIQRSSQSISVDIEDFADVNLRDILDGAKRLQNELDLIKRQRDQLISERDSRIGQAENARDRAIALVREADLNAAEQRNRITSAGRTADETIASITAEYAPRLSELETRIAELEIEIAAYDTRQLEQAKEQEEVLNNQRQVFDLEKQEQARQYEEQIERLVAGYESQIQELEAYQVEFEESLRSRHQRELAAQKLLYNPRLGDDAVAPLLSQPLRGVSFTGPGTYDQLLGRENVISQTAYAEVEREYSELLRLLDRVQTIPYENSVPDVLAQVRDRTLVLLKHYEDVRIGMGAVVRAKDAEIARRDGIIRDMTAEIGRFNYALEQYSRIGGDTGYVLDTRESTSIQVYVNPLRTVESGTIGYVFRADDEYIGTIRFGLQNGRLRARVVEIAPEQELRPYDKVLIEVQ